MNRLCCCFNIFRNYASKICYLRCIETALHYYRNKLYGMIVISASFTRPNKFITHKHKMFPIRLLECWQLQWANKFYQRDFGRCTWNSILLRYSKTLSTITTKQLRQRVTVVCVQNFCWTLAAVQITQHAYQCRLR